MIDKLKTFIPTISKAIAGALAGVIIKYCVDNNIVIDGASLGAHIEYLITLVIGFVFVYFSPPNKG